MSSSNDSKPDNYHINAKICRLVERYPCMYDRSHQHYLKKDVVDKAWVKIAKEMDDSIPSCKERWRNIRTSFARSINVNKIPASANRTKPYYLHEELQFLARHITPGIPVSRRSNPYYSAGEESEAIEVAVGEESFDGFAAMVLDDEESQGQQSSVDEHSEAFRNDAQMQQMQAEQQQQQLQIEQAQQQRRQQLLEDEEHEAEAAVVAQPQLQYTCPPKKRRTMDVLPDMERDIKPIDLPPPASAPDFDALFLQGLVPEMKAMDFRQKILFKRRIYEVIGEVFESAAARTTTTAATTTFANCNSTTNGTPKSSPSSSSFSIATPTFATATPTMTVVNAADLAMIRKLYSLLQSPTAAVASSTVTAVPKNVASISSTVRSTTPATATVAVHRGALTRSSTNLLRVTMVNPPTSISSTPQPLVVKQEPEVIDD